MFKTNLIIDELKLNWGFVESELSFKVHRSTVLSIAVIVIGGLIFVDGLPELCVRTYRYFQEKRMTGGYGSQSLAYIIFAGIKVVSGLILMAAHRPIVNLIELKKKNPPDRPSQKKDQRNIWQFEDVKYI